MACSGVIRLEISRVVKGLYRQRIAPAGILALAIATYSLAPAAAFAAPGASARVSAAVRHVGPGGRASAAVALPGLKRAGLSTARLARPRSSGPGTGSQLILDPGFERGSPNPYWAEASSGNLSVIDQANAHSGALAADLCGYNNCVDSVTQKLSFTVPTGIVRASLSFYFWMGTQEAATTCLDNLTAGLTDLTALASNGSAVQLCTDWADAAWHQQTLDETAFLQAHAGMQVQVIAQGTSDNDAAFTRSYVDDFALSIVTAPGVPTSMLVRPGNSAATINWLPPDDGGSPITSYTITPYTNNGNTAGTPVTFYSASTSEVMTGLVNGTAYSFTVSAANAAASGAPTGQSAPVVPDRSYGNEAVSTQQYLLQNSDGVHWSDIDANYLSARLTAPADSLAIVSANADLWTASAGYNQDIGITVAGGAYPSRPGEPEAWKESGGYAGTFSPNAAFVQTVLALKAGTSYSLKLQWKTNRSGTGTTIVAGAGSGIPFSPTRMTIQLLPASGTPLASPSLATAAGTLQYQLTGSNATWGDLGPGAPPTISFKAPENGTILVSGNADLWTAAAGLNQDLGISVSGGIYPTTPGQPEAWKESGGYAGTFSPNAAYVQAQLPVVKNGDYLLKLQWKTNKPAGAGESIFAGAGSAPSYSPTRLTAVFTPAGGGALEASSTAQYSLPNSDGTNWSNLDGSKLVLHLTPTNNCVATLGANADLWTANAGINQDLGIQVSSTLGTYSPERVGWKESGGYAGTFSPNAAFLQTLFPMKAGTAYTVMLQWKTNRPASGKTIFAAAGGGPVFSPTRLTAQLACPAAAQVAVSSAPQTLTAGVPSGLMTVQLQDTYGNPVTAGTAGQVVSLGTSSAGGSFQDGSGTTITAVTIAAGSSSASFKYTDTVAGNPTITVQAPPLTPGTQVEAVNPNTTSQLVVTAPAAATHGTPVTVTVTAADRYGNLTRGYAGTVHFTSSDGGAVLPANYTFVAADNGSHSFSVTLNTAGPQSVTATDTGNSQITGTSASITVG